jgi:hypothetical protein
MTCGSKTNKSTSTRIQHQSSFPYWVPEVYLWNQSCRYNLLSNKRTHNKQAANNKIIIKKKQLHIHHPSSQHNNNNINKERKEKKEKQTEFVKNSALCTVWSHFNCQDIPEYWSTIISKEQLQYISHMLSKIYVCTHLKHACRWRHWFLYCLDKIISMNKLKYKPAVISPPGPAVFKADPSGASLSCWLDFSFNDFKLPPDCWPVWGLVA